MLIINGKIVTWELPNRILDGRAVYIQGDQIIEVGNQADLLNRYPNEERVDAAGQLVMPGIICAHTHFYGAFGRGMAISGPAPKSFPEVLEKLWWKLDRALTLEDVEYSTLVCLIDAIKHGTTTLVDHHASPNAISGSLDVISDAIDRSGLRGCLCYEVTDRNGEDGMIAGVEENVRFLNKLSEDHLNGRLAGLFGLHASLTLSEKTLEYCVKNAFPNIGFHIHVAEHPVDQDDSMEKSGTRVVDRLARHGILRENSILVHAVHLDAREIQLITDAGAWVTHQPRSNMNNGVGLGDVEAMIRAGVKVCIGNDGFSNAMWEEWKTAYLVHKLWNKDPRRMNGNTLMQMAVYQNSALATSLFGRQIGMITPGAQADIIFVDYKPFTELTAGNLPWHIIFGFRDGMVTTTIAAGKLLMKNRKIMARQTMLAIRAVHLKANSHVVSCSCCSNICTPQVIWDCGIPNSKIPRFQIPNSKIPNSRIPNSKFQDSKFKIQSSKPKVQSPKIKAQSSEAKDQSPKFKAQRSKPKVQSPKFKAQSSKPKDQSPKFKAQRSKPKDQRSKSDVHAAIQNQKSEILLIRAAVTLYSGVCTNRSRFGLVT